MLRMIKRVAVAAAVVTGATLVLAAPASAAQDPALALPAQACTTLTGPAGGKLPLCKSWVRNGDAYDGRWWGNGPSTLPTKTYLQRSEDGHITSSDFSGSYYKRKKVLFRLCDRLAGRCSGWW
ncbi:hypothetical protein [Streptoalloteichus hindustanus]|uniref:Peptidase inhibitor family I36 n=1 Tax=Streptoalloteichus hindustanus TaxID=2017 RepID=A0A1M5D561_STRHI|nr:hypothetical protein [Streptoalloteichus hindustanus]SHF61987.1 hypothetical protein SAMN05444320_104300 [Streptoalloteichus hindustanus]